MNLGKELGQISLLFLPKGPDHPHLRAFLQTPEKFLSSKELEAFDDTLLRQEIKLQRLLTKGEGIPGAALIIERVEKIVNPNSNRLSLFGRIQKGVAELLGNYSY